MSPRAEMTLRIGGPDDACALRRLVERDSALPLAGRVLCAEAGGELIAAIEIGTGRVVADPFIRTADAVELLRRRAAQIRRVDRGGPSPLRSLRALGRRLPA